MVKGGCVIYWSREPCVVCASVGDCLGLEDSKIYIILDSVYFMIFYSILGTIV